MKFWTPQEKKLLKELRDKNIPYREILQHFPDKKISNLRSTYSKMKRPNKGKRNKGDYLHPLMHQMHSIFMESGKSYLEISKGSKVDKATISRWLRNAKGHYPKLYHFESVLNELGYYLTIQKRTSVRSV